MFVSLLKLFIPDRFCNPEKSNKSSSPSPCCSWFGQLYNDSDMRAIKEDRCGFASKFEFRVGENVWAKPEFEKGSNDAWFGFGKKPEFRVVCAVIFGEGGEDAWGFVAVIFVDGTAGTCTGNVFGWMMGDASEFGVVASVGAREPKVAGLCDFSAHSDARWRRSSLATMQN